MSLQHHDNGKQGGVFLLDDAGQENRETHLFCETPIPLMLINTFVDDSLRGQGGRQTLSSLNSFIQAKKLTLHPTCSYIARKWERTHLLNHKLKPINKRLF